MNRGHDSFLSLINMQGQLQTKIVEYKHDGAVLEGYLAYQDSNKRKRPGVLVVHAFNGLGSFVKKRTERLAELGYVAFALDMYGKGVRPTSFEAAAAEARKYMANRQLLRARANAGLEVLRSHQLSDARRMATISYCFGGATVLELARSGADLAGVVSFHGTLDTPNPDDAKNIRGKLLVLHGADDPFVPTSQVAAFQEEMRKAGVDWQMIIYGGAVHAFTDPAAGYDKSKGAAFDEKADKRAWQAMKQFFDEIFR